MNLKTARLAAAFLLGMIPAVCHAQDFSADVVYLSNGKAGAASNGTGTSSRPSSRLYVSKDKLRLETHGLNDTVLVADRGERTAFALLPSQKAYQALATGPSEYFRVENPDDACPDWQKVSDRKIDCEKVGPEVVDGRQAMKYQNKRASDTATAVWIDLALKYVIKWEDASAGAELRNIKEAQQSADLFTLPSNYDSLKPKKATSKGFSQR
jgi:hypothetical protein